jgi:hypothetical protein
VNPVDFIVLADALGSKEADHRAAIGRYYYGVFNRLKSDLAAKHSVQFTKKSKDHGIVRDNVAKLDTAPAGKPTARFLLESLRGLRNQADYDLASSVTAADRTAAKRLSDDIRMQTGGW